MGKSKIPDNVFLWGSKTVNKRCLSGVDWLVPIGLCLGNIIWRFVIEYKNINLIMKLEVTLKRQFYYEDSINNGIFVELL